jgi:hypothetical protein
MKRFFFFGEDVVPLRIYIKTYKEQLEKITKLRIRNVALRSNRDEIMLELQELKKKYQAMLKQTPARGKDGRFIHR